MLLNRNAINKRCFKAYFLNLYYFEYWSRSWVITAIFYANRKRRNIRWITREFFFVLARSQKWKNVLLSLTLGHGQYIICRCFRFFSRWAQRKDVILLVYIFDFNNFFLKYVVDSTLLLQTVRNNIFVLIREREWEKASQNTNENHNFDTTIQTTHSNES